MSELIAVVGCTISHAAGSTITGGAFVITTPPSAKTSAGQPAYRGPISFTFSGGSEPTVVAGTVTGSGTINPTAVKVKADALAVVREGDTGTLTGTGTNPAPPPATLPVSGPVEISAAGQVKAKAN